MFIFFFTLVVLICCWWVGEMYVRTKVIFTLLYLGSFGLLFIKQAGFLFIIAQCVLTAIIGSMTFGVEWLNRRMR